MNDTAQNASPLVLVVDDEAWVRHFLENVLRDRGYRTIGVSDSVTSFNTMKEEEVDLVLVDLTIDSFSGFDVIKSALSAPSRPEVVVITGDNRVENAVDALESGAFEFLAKPLDSQRLHLTLQRALEHRRLKAEIIRLSGGSGIPHHIHLSSRTLAFYDPITGLANRALFFDRLDRILLTQPNVTNNIVLMVFTIREIRHISLLYGTEEADAVLAAVSLTIQGYLFDRDTVARTGDNEISIIADLGSTKNMTHLVSKIESAAGEITTHSGHSHFVSFAGGAAIHPDDADNSSKLYQHALSALEAVEQRGERGFGVYHPEIDNAVQRRMGTERLLAKALSSHEYFVELQPYHRLADGGVQGAETLLRWKTEDGKIVSPAQFIPILEANFGIIPVTEWIVHQLAAIQKQLIERGRGNQYLSLNLSPVHFAHKTASRRLAEMIVGVLPDPSHIIVELTEGALLKDVDTCMIVLRTLGEQGVSIAIDDFGTGYSSLSYLTRYPVDYLKIDRSFVRYSDTRDDLATIVAAIISMAQQLGIAVIAEGAETEGEIEFLKSYGCDTVQGYAYTKPLGIPQYYEYIEENTSIIEILTSVV